MESGKKWLTDRSAKKNGLYVHYSPPKLVGVIPAAQLRQWARGGAESRLERAVLAGQGRRLLAEAEALPLAPHLPALVAKCDALHTAVERGSLLELQELLEPDYQRRKYVMCRDEAGAGLLHKAVFHDYMDIVEYLVRNYPQLVHQKDSEGRTPLHYTAVCRDEAGAAGVLEGAGAARGARDAAGRTPAGYRGAARTLLALPTTAAMAPETARNPPGLVIKRHNIRIWCHDCDMARLQRVVWEGHGGRLLSEVSNQPVVKRFLEAVPYIMNTIRDIHNAVVQNDLEGLMKHAGDPVPPQALSSRDTNNMTVMHKAAGLGHGSILKYIAERYPQGINDVDNDGRTPLHYAAAIRDEQHTYNTLVGLGADESALDNKNKTPGYYINRSQEIDKNLFKTLPEAPRTASSAYPSSWDWKLLDNYVIVDLNKKSRRRHLKASNENLSSKNNTNTISESTENHTGAMKASSTHELIKDLPELEESNKANKDESENHNEILESNEETEVVEETHDTEGNTGQEDEETKIADEKLNNTEEKSETIEVNADDTKEAVDNEEKFSDNAEDNLEMKDLKDIIDHKENVVENTEESLVTEASIDKNEDTDENKLANNDKNQEPTTDYDDKNNEDVGTGDKEENNQAVHASDTEEKPEENDQISQSLFHTDDHSEEANLKVVSSEVSENASPEQDDVKVNSNGEHNNNSNDDLKDIEDHYHNDPKNDNNTQAAEELDALTNEGNSNSEHNEDDDDVQAEGDNHSEYSDFNLKSTVEISDSGSAKRGNVINGRHTQESLIEGIISSDADQDSQDASMTQGGGPVHGELFVVDSEIDPEVADLLNNANMEMLATLVLNGEGSRLIGRRSGNTELQSFLDNVPTYMQKINRVHLAAKEGNIKDLQAALDRRKFAIARDPISANGATPLHVATVFGKTNIMKYLGGRFPETLSAVDFEGRTALHYAAVLPDNEHYYNLLQQLGANSKDLDDNGRSAEDYNKNPCLLPLDQLLSDFGINEEAVQNMFSDKGPNQAANGHMDIPIFRTEEGRYLAKSLGDPLIKGLTEVANVKPKDPVAFLASFLQNFPENEKPQIDTQESNMMAAVEETEVENKQPPPELAPALMANGPRNGTRTATRPDRPIDVVAVDPRTVVSPDAPETAFSSANRDEHGQSMLHFAAARAHARNALFQLLQESDISLGYRDELYRTARDVSIQANVPENTTELDKWVLHLAARGNTDKIMEMLLEGYDHILDVVDESGVLITEVITQRGDSAMSGLLASIPAFEESRESFHAAVRRGDLGAVKELLSEEGGRTLARSQNSFGRTALHVAVLAQHEDLVAYLAQTFPVLLRIGDNLERTPLHYAMGVDKIESLSRILIRAGAKRVLKDLKGRQPTYYFMNRSDIQRLKEEEEVYGE